MSPRLAQAVAIAAAGFAVSTSAAHASTWSAPVTVAAATGSAPAVSPAVGVDADGDLTAVWAGDGAAGYGVYSATRAADPSSPWSTAVRIATASQARNVQVSVNASGQVVAGWTDVGSAQVGLLMSAGRSAAGTWSPAKTITTASDSEPFQRLSLDNAGRPVGLYAQDGDLFGLSGLLGDLLGLTKPPASSVSLENSPFEIGLDAAGTATVVFADNQQIEIQTATRPAGGNWSTPTPLETWSHSSDPDLSRGLRVPQLAVAPDGKAVAAWTRSDGANPPQIQASTKLPNGTWGAPTTVYGAPELQAITALDVSIDADGRRTALWSYDAQRSVSGQAVYTSQVLTSRTTVGGGWGAASPLSVRFETTDITTTPFLHFAAPQLAAGRGGQVLATWKQGFAPSADLQGAVRTADGPWEPVTAIATSITVADDDLLSAAAAVDANGRATTIWTDGGSVRSRTVAIVAPPVPGPVVKDPDPVVKDPDPVVKDPDPVVKDPAQTAGGPGPAASDPTTTASPNAGTGTSPSALQTPTKTAAPAKLVISLYVTPSGKKCPTVAAATVDGARTNLKVTKTKLRKKLACKVTGTVVLKPTVKAGTKVTVLITAKGIKKKSVQLPAVA